MSRFPRIPLAWFLLCGPAAAAPGDPSGLHIAPYLQNVTPTSITVMWETAEPAIGVVEYGRNGSFRNRAGESEPRKIHEVTLTGLEPGTRYGYRVSWGGKKLQPSSFETAPPPGTPNWRFVVYGDNRSNPEAHSRNVEQILRHEPAIIINTGDLVASGTEYDQWKPQYFDPLRPVAERIPIFPCLGNHERNADHYYNYHSLPSENGEVFYSFDYGNAHILALNSNAGDAPFDLDSEQTQWIIRDLEKHRDATWKIVFFHHPLFRSHLTRGVTPQRWVWQRIFEEHGVDIVLNGHDHYYMRAYPIGDYTGEPKRGLFHLISGGGGAPTYPMAPKPHAAFRQRVHHITVFDVMGDRMVGRAVDIDGNVFDAFVVDKRVVNSPEEFMAFEVYELERDLSAAIHELPVTAASGSGVSIDARIEVPNPFRAPLEMRFSWKGTNGWRVEPQRLRLRLVPGEPIALPVRAEFHGSGDMYPLPTAELAFLREDGEKAFRNDRVEFYPLRVSLRRALEVPSVSAAPRVDGDASEATWQNAVAITSFVDAQGSERPHREVVARLLRHEGKLYVAAQMETPPGIGEQGYEGRDNSRAFRDDHFRLILATASGSYTFGVTAHGAPVDAKGDDLSWDSSFETAVQRGPNGWRMEMAVPLDELPGAGGDLRFNLVRRDVAANAFAELAPTFGESDLDHRVPMYESDPTAAGRFVELHFE